MGRGKGKNAIECSQGRAKNVPGKDWVWCCLTRGQWDRFCRSLQIAQANNHSDRGLGWAATILVEYGLVFTFYSVGEGYRVVARTWSRSLLQMQRQFGGAHYLGDRTRKSGTENSPRMSYCAFSLSRYSYFHLTSWSLGGRESVENLILSPLDIISTSH